MHIWAVWAATFVTVRKQPTTILETLPKGAKRREVWESKSGFLASGVRHFRAWSPGLLPPP